jgi:hypothetical protein
MMPSWDGRYYLRYDTQVDAPLSRPTLRPAVIAA